MLEVGTLEIKSIALTYTSIVKVQYLCFYLFDLELS